MDTQEYTPEQQELLAQFKSGLSEESATAMVGRIAGLEAQIATLKASGQDPAIGDEIVRLTGELKAANARADAAEKDRDHAKSSAKALAKQASPSPRKLGKLGDGKGLKGGELREAIDDADEVEIAFSNGRNEVAGLAPVAIAGENAWKEHPTGLMLTTPVTVHGPAAGHTGFVVEGYALLLDGKQVAYAAASSPHNIAANQTMKFENEIVFA